MVLADKHVSSMINCYQVIGESENYVETTNCNNLPHVCIYSCVLSTATKGYSCLSVCMSALCACDALMFSICLCR